MIRKRLHLTPAHKARGPYHYVPLAVPDGTTRIDVRMSYPRAEDCIVDLGIGDPRLGSFPARTGFRGWSGGARDGFFVATDDATPGYVPGPMPPGDWQIVLGLYRIPARGAEFSLEIECDATAREVTEIPEPRLVVRPGARWYRGDLHCHCWHSDAAGSPETLHAAARQAGLDFLAVADHNTITQRRYFLPRSSPDLLFIRAMEVTNAEGHANAFGTEGWIDFRFDRPEDAHAMAAEVHRQGGILSINHDKPDIPWKHAWPDADCMEVWQHPWLARNWVSLARWQRRLAEGARLPAIGGSDWHQPADLRPEGPFTLARPTTVLHLPELSEAAVLEGMAAGRGYITEAPEGPHLDLRIGTAGMGGTARPGDAVEIRTERADGDLLTLHDASGEIARHRIDGPAATIRPKVAPRRFLRAEIVAEASHERLMRGFRDAFPNGLPWGLTEGDIAGQPLRRALSNPVWLAEG